MGYYHSAWSTYQSGTWFYFSENIWHKYIWKSPSWGDVSIVPSHPSQRPVPGQSLPSRVSTKTRPTHASTIVFSSIPPFKIDGGPAIKVEISSRSNYGEGLKFLVSTSFSPRRHVTRCRSRDWAHNKAPVLSTCEVEYITSWYQHPTYAFHKTFQGKGDFSWDKRKFSREHSEKHFVFHM